MQIGQIVYATARYRAFTGIIREIRRGRYYVEAVPGRSVVRGDSGWFYRRDLEPLRVATPLHQFGIASDG